MLAADLPYALGCPVWACEHWRGGLYTAKARREQWLEQYSAVFNTVEGNSTFYALPTLEAAARWARSTADGFEFCLKVPRAITHDRMLQRADDATRSFFAVLDVLAEHDRLGPSFLQLPPNFDASGFESLVFYLRQWPRHFPLAVEVRHRDWFDRGRHELALGRLLEDVGRDRVLFDSRALYATPPDTPAEEVSQTRKPKSPIRRTVNGERPFVRFIGRDDVTLVDPWIEEWSQTVAGWLNAGLKPLVFTHAPDDTFAPEFARRFHRALATSLSALPPLPEFPGETEPSPDEQLSLF